LHFWFVNGQEKLFWFNSYLDVPVYQKPKNEAFANLAFCFNGTVARDNRFDFDLNTLFLESGPFKQPIK